MTDSSVHDDSRDFPLDPSSDAVTQDNASDAASAVGVLDPAETMADADPMEAENSSLLNSLVAELRTLTDDGGDTGAALIQRYTEQVSRIAGAAAEAGYTGLTDVCLLYQEGITALDVSSMGMTQGPYRLLEVWPDLVRSYLDQPLPEAAEALIDHLRHPELAAALSNEDAGLVQAALTEDLPERASDDRGVIKAEADRLDELPSADGDLMELLLVEESAPLSDDEGREPQMVPAGAEESSAQPLPLEDTKAGLPAGLPPADDDLMGLLLATESAPLSDGQTTGQRIAPTGAAENLERPPTPEETEADLAAGLPAADDDLMELLLAGESAPLAVTRDDASSVLKPAQTMADTDSTEQGVSSLLDSLVAELRTLMDGGGDTGVALIQRYTEQVSRIAGVAAEAGYTGLTDVCLLYQEGITALDPSSMGMTQGPYRLLEVWPDLVRAYLDQPLPEAAEALIDHLRHPELAAALSNEDAGLVQAALTEDLPERASDDRGAIKAEADRLDELPSADGDLMELLLVEESAPLSEDKASALQLAPVGAGDSLARPSSLEAASPVGEMSPEIRKLVDLLVEELPLMEEQLDTVLEQGASEDLAPDARQETLGIYADYLERFGEAAQAVGFEGLQQVCGCTRGNMLHLSSEGRAIKPNEAAVLKQWTGRVRAYLDAPHDPSVCEALVEVLTSASWPQPLAADVTGNLCSLLQAPTLTAGEEEAAPRPQHATPEDVSLALPEDVNSDLLDAMLQELPGHTEEFSNAIQNLTAGGTPQDVRLAQRIAHTLKGTGNTVGVYGLANLAHHLEDILVALAEHQSLPTRILSMALMNAADCLEGMSEALTGAGEPPPDAPAVLQDILDWANYIDRKGLPQADERPAAADTMTVATALKTEESSESKSEVASPTAVPPTIRVPAELVDNLMRLTGEAIILSGQLHEQLGRAIQQSQTMRQQFNRLQRLGTDLERLIDIKDLSSEWQRRSQDSHFDALEMDQYSELHTHSRMLVEAATDSRELGISVLEQLARLDDMLVTQERLNGETQEAALSARMVPIKSILPRLQRSVRQACRLTGKQAELHFSGVDTVMDGEVLNGMLDPLMHLLRNAVDHGIEASEQRAAAGKGPVGNIWLDFLRDGNHVLMRCKDDGVGLDLDAIHRTATERGVLDAAKATSEEALKRLVLMPNFSTRADITQTSGRGIGMDVVYSRVLELGGSLELESVPCKGCLVELRLPVTLISTHALLVSAGEQRLAIANRGVEQILHSQDGELRRFGSEEILQVGEDTYPVMLLESMLNLAAPEQHCDRRPALLVRDEMGVSAILVEKVLSNRNLVVKHLGRYVPKLRGIIGATILGDGTVTPVLDLPELLRGAHQKGLGATADTQYVQSQTPNSPVPSVLVVDDSLSARRALLQIMEDSGYEVHAARDGMEAIELIEKKQPCIVLADMEMPRMNGIELTSHVRAHDKTARLPVIMITSRSTRKHREQAEAAGVNAYLTKPFSEDELLEQIEALRRRE